MENQRLSLSGDSIRLLILSQKHISDPITCTSTIVHLHEEPQYIAVSYRWGEVTLTDEIIVDHKRVRVTKSVVEVLLCLRSFKYSCPLWLDFLCINQLNTAERNHQVGMMGRIFASAKYVIAWLGPGYDNSELAMRLLRDYPDGHSKSARSDPQTCESNHQTLRFPFQIQYGQDQAERVLLGTEMLAALRSLCQRDYWSRTWVIQEVLLAQDVMLCCGDTYAPLQNLCKILNPDLSDTALWHLLRGRMCHQLLEHKAADMKLGMADLLKRYNHSRCADSRDKIYALLNLAEDRSGFPMLEPDYYKSAETLWTDVSRIFRLDDAGSDEIKSMLNYIFTGRRPSFGRFSTVAPDQNPFYVTGYMLLFSGQITQKGDDLALRVLRDDRTKELCLEAVADSGEVRWFAIIDQCIRLMQWTSQCQHNPSRIFFAELLPRIADVEWVPSRANLRYHVDFAIREDAHAFLDVVDELFNDLHIADNSYPPRSWNRGANNRNAALESEDIGRDNP